MAQIDIDLDLDQISDKDILEEFESRLHSGWRKTLNVNFKNKAIKILKADIGFDDCFDVEKLNLADKMKFDFFIENFDRITEDQLRKLF